MEPAGRSRPIITPPDPALRDGVVVLRPPHERDLPAIELGINDPDVLRWFGPPDAGATELLALNRRRWAAGSPTFAICEDDDSCVGHVFVNVSATDATTGAVGYRLLPSACGRGLATTAVRLVSDWAVRELGITRLCIFIEPGNVASQRVAERSGFRRVGLLAANGEVAGRRVDHVMYQLPVEST